MTQIIGKTDMYLGRAALALVLAVLTSTAFMFLLENLGYSGDLSFWVVVLAMPFIAWLISRAARRLGKNSLVYGLMSLFPPLAVLSLAWLYQEDLRRRIDGN